MRLLVVGHTYVTPFAQAKYVAMKALREDLVIRLVVPPAVAHVFGAYRAELASELASEEVVVVRSFGGASHMTYILDPFALSALIREFKPTHIHVEEDPHSAVGCEVAGLAAALSPKASLSFFVWDNLNRVPRFPFGAVKRKLTQFSLSRTSLVICGNEKGKELLPVKGYHGRAEVIPQIGLDPAGLSRARNRERVPTVGYLGRLVEEKGLRDLFAALQTLLDLPWRLIILGDGPLRQEIEAQGRTLFADRLVCDGPVSHRDVQEELQKVDVFVLPSYSLPTWEEQFGLTLAQAMLAGCACIGSSSGAIPEVLAGTGLIFSERDVLALAGALRQLIESPEDRERLGDAARLVALQRYTNHVVALRHLQAFEQSGN